MDDISSKAAAPVSCDIETQGLAWSLKNSPVYDIDYITNAQNAVISKIEGNTNILADSEEVPPAGIINEYHHLRSQLNYWKNKHNDLMQAFKILSAYDIDVDYTELLLRTREAARYRKDIACSLEKMETDYPAVPRYNAIVFLEDNNHDPILDRAWSKVEKKKLSFNKQYSFVDYLRDNKNRSQGTASAVGSL